VVDTLHVMTRLASLLIALTACGSNSGGEGTPDSGNDPDACTDLSCKIEDCAAQGLPPTTVSGVVNAPNGTLPLYGVTVYVPQSTPGPLTDGVQCGQCQNLPGGSIVQAQTDEMGRFSLENVPVATDVPLVIQVGKWRRQLVLPAVQACADNPLPAAETRLPRTASEGDIPRIAITTGNADAIECLVRKLGIDDSEFTTDAGTGRVHMYAGNGANKFRVGFAGGTGNFPAATTLWNTTAKLSNYDITLFSCESSQNPGTKSQAAMQAVQDYANLGGRLFMSHWHNIWVGGNKDNASHGLADWKTIATFDFGAAQPDASQTAIIDETVPKGPAFASWMQNVGGSPVARGKLTVNDPRYIAQTIDTAKAERWVYIDPAQSTPAGRSAVQDFLFTTPNDVPPEQRCGKVVFSDMHVSSGSTSAAANPFPNGCSTTDLSAQEKALAFMFFDISSCINPIF
jgi:hypothetical protein